jgi:hypothetical protein
MVRRTSPLSPILSAPDPSNNTFFGKEVFFIAFSSTVVYMIVGLVSMDENEMTK